MNNKRTFVDLMEDPNFVRIEIPIIQRDYAQGRPSAAEIREHFLISLHNTLTQEPPTLVSLDLDFVYGNVEEKQKSFCPLDGQQRLTTLFLLHWYLAHVDGKVSDFHKLVTSSGHSRFTYSVRRSSQEFLDALVTKDVVVIPETKDANPESWKPLSVRIKDAPWFFLSWKLDPTIQSALGMLDAIEERFGNTTNLYARLVQKESPCITFQFLNLKDFGLSDDLYIKMNARGKPLTVFEAFKARLEQQIGKELRGQTKDLGGHPVSLQQYFSHKIDTTWSDLFWQFRDEKNPAVDSQIMNFIRAVIFVHYPHYRGEARETETNQVMGDLYNLYKEWTYLTYQSKECLTAGLLRNLITLLDKLVGPEKTLRTYLPDNKYYDERRMFGRVIAGKPRDVTYTEWIQFYGYCAFLIDEDNPDEQKFNEWMRVVFNLSTNTIYNRIDEVRNALLSIRTLLDEAKRTPLLAMLAQRDGGLKGFLARQYQEERLKAEMMTRRPHWQAMILGAEQHGYFRGQIEFLLKFSGALDKWTANKSTCTWSDAEDDEITNAFTAYTQKAASVFETEGVVNFPDQQWERALLAKGDYLISSGSNWCFLTNPIGNRETSWKRLLRGDDRVPNTAKELRDHIRVLFDCIDPTKVTESLDQVISEFLSKPTDAANQWRRKIIECPATIRYCKKRFIRENGDRSYYLLSKERMSGRHVELFTYHLYNCILTPCVKSKKCLPFDLCGYEEMTTDSIEPYTYLRWKGKSIELRIEHHSTGYYLSFEKLGGIVPQKIIDVATNDLGFELLPFDTVRKLISHDAVESEISTIAAKLTEIDW